MAAAPGGPGLATKVVTCRWDFSGSSSPLPRASSCRGGRATRVLQEPLLADVMAEPTWPPLSLS